MTVLAVCLSGCGGASASEEGGDGGGEGIGLDGEPDGGAESPTQACVRLLDSLCDYLADCQGADEEACLADSGGSCAGAVDADHDGVDSCVENLREVDCDDALPRSCDDELITFDDECDGICLSGCGSNEFRCARSEECLPVSALCDGVADCDEGADESRCNNPGCGPDQLSCADGTCIPMAWRCDGDDDCSSADDEEMCGGCSDAWTCDDGTCVDEGALCDLNVDCPDGSDEPPGCSDE